MTQRDSRKRKVVRTLPPHPEDERALQRIRFHVSEWDQLNWYIRFAREGWEQLSPGEQLSLREEIKAVERTLVRRMEGAEGIPDRDDREIQDIQGVFRQKLTELADTGCVYLGPFEACVFLGEGWWGEQLAGGKWLEYHFAQLLKKFPEAIQRCPKCHSIFLRPRSNAYYCSRACQNIAAMRKLRQRKKRTDRKAELEPRRTRGRSIPQRAVKRSSSERS